MLCLVHSWSTLFGRIVFRGEGAEVKEADLFVRVPSAEGRGPYAPEAGHIVHGRRNAWRFPVDITTFQSSTLRALPTAGQKKAICGYIASGMVSGGGLGPEKLRIFETTTGLTWMDWSRISSRNISGGLRPGPRGQLGQLGKVAHCRRGGAQILSRLSLS